MLSFICLSFSHRLQAIAFSLLLLTTLLPYMFKFFHLHLTTMLNLASKPSILYEHSVSPNSPPHGRADARAPLLVLKLNLYYLCITVTTIYMVPQRLVVSKECVCVCVCFEDRKRVFVCSPSEWPFNLTHVGLDPNLQKNINND
jgi:hypothetical protein